MSLGQSQSFEVGSSVSEHQRLAALRGLGVLDTPRERPFDELVELAASLLGMPIALVSLIDRDRQWFKAAHGLDLDETPRDLSFCAHTIEHGELLVVEDATLDDRFSDNPLVIDDPSIRFYAGAPLVTEDGHVVGTLCVIDRTARTLDPSAEALLRVLARQAMVQFELRAAAEALRRSEERFRLLFDSVPVGVFLTNPEGNCELVNPAWCTTAGINRTDARGWGWLASIHPDDRERVSREWASTAHSHAGFDSHYRVQRPSGEARHVVGRARALFAQDGEIDGFVGTVLDVTEHHLAAAEQSRSEARRREAERVDSLLLFAGGLAHDHNNLLTAIVSNLSLVAADVPPGAPGTAALARAHHGLEAVADLARELLDFTGNGASNKRSVSLAEIVREAHQLLAPPDRGTPEIPISLEIDWGLPPFHGDPVQLARLIFNLLDNARQAIENQRDGVIMLRLVRATCEQIEQQVLGTGAPRDWIAITVSDNGEGISADILPRIFDPFFTTRESGRGLGLATVSGIVKGHNGHIRVTSGDPTGTTFTVLLPIAPSSTDALQSQRRLTALIVDDHDAVRDATRAVLQRAGFDVYEARDGIEALELCDLLGATVDVILLDVVMPALSGHDTFEELRRRGHQTPVVFTSGYSTIELDRPGSSTASCAFLSKPYRPEMLTKALRDAVLAHRSG